MRKGVIKIIFVYFSDSEPIYIQNCCASSSTFKDLIRIPDNICKPFRHQCWATLVKHLAVRTLFDWTVAAVFDLRYFLIFLGVCLIHIIINSAENASVFFRFFHILKINLLRHTKEGVLGFWGFWGHHTRVPRRG